MSPSCALRMWRRNWTLYRRTWRRTLLPSFMEPFTYVLAIGVGLGAFIDDGAMGVPYALFLAPGLIAGGAMNGSVFETTYPLFFKLQGTRLYDAIITTPIEPQDAMAGEILWAASRALLYAAPFVIVSTLLGYVRSPQALLLVVVLPAVGVVFGLLGLLLTSFVRKLESISYFFTLVINPMFLLGGVFFPVDRLPDAIQRLVWLAPLYHVVEITRALTMGLDLRAVLGNALWLVVLGALLYPVAMWRMRARLVEGTGE